MNITNPTNFGIPGLTLTTANAEGTGNAIRTGASILTYDATLPDAITFGQSGSAGSQATAARRDHAHAMAADPATAAASAAEMLAASITTVYASPGRTQNHPGVAKVWAMVNAAGSLLSPNYNVASVTPNATGDRTVVFTTDFSDQQYNCHGLSDENAISVYAERTDVGSSRFVVGNNAATPVATNAYIGMAYFGEQ